MNHRIYELMEQAYDEYTDPITDIPEYAFSREKFAKLIINECLNIVGHYTDVDEGIAVVKKNFGIE